MKGKRSTIWIQRIGLGIQRGNDASMLGTIQKFRQDCHCPQVFQRLSQISLLQLLNELLMGSLENSMEIEFAFRKKYSSNESMFIVTLPALHFHLSVE